MAETGPTLGLITIVCEPEPPSVMGDINMSSPQITEVIQEIRAAFASHGFAMLELNLYRCIDTDRNPTYTDLTSQHQRLERFTLRTGGSRPPKPYGWVFGWR